MGSGRNRPNAPCATRGFPPKPEFMQILCPRCLDDERGGYSLCSRCGQHFPLVKLVVDVPEARPETRSETRPETRMDEPCELCDREEFFGHHECGHCGRTLRPIRVAR
jgi:hypothetical protein